MPSAAEIYYYAYQGGDGDRPCVVLIHGAGGTHLYWPSEVRRLPGYRIFALDLPGHGKSGGRGLQSIGAYTDAVLEWMQVVNLHRAVFVGHSMGSAIAMRLAIEQPEHVLGLGLLGAGARLRVHPDILQNTSNETTFQRAIDQVVGCSFSEQAPARLVELAAKRMAETRPSVLHGDFLACDAFDEMERVSQISQPTIVICGADDQLTPARYAQFLADKIPGAHLEMIPNAGHMVMLERPNIVAEVMTKFLDGIPYYM
jgi:pimeloyl-ACP methyl ester carboxylesterase